MKNLKINAIKNNQDKAMQSLLAIEEALSNVIKIHPTQFDKNDTAIIYVDMIKGFVNEGALQSPRAETIRKNIKKLDTKTKGFNKVFFIDSHTKDSAEFKAYPEHCIAGTSESELIDDYDTDNNKSIVIEKNSVNGFFAPMFASWLKVNQGIKNFIIVGLVTDICVMNFALSLKAYFNQWNVDVNIMVPMNCVETFDLDANYHEASIMNIFALYNMQMNGINIVEY